MKFSPLNLQDFALKFAVKLWAICKPLKFSGLRNLRKTAGFVKIFHKNYQANYPSFPACEKMAEGLHFTNLFITFAANFGSGAVKAAAFRKTTMLWTRHTGGGRMNTGCCSCNST
ncbi:MAG: hypothetical protein IJ928_07260 [Prevotella sp.]|nr:hypothetical protein [Prevotella sp.]